MSLSTLVTDSITQQRERRDSAALADHPSTRESTNAAIRPKQAARRMGFSDATFWRKVREGKIKVTKISERITVVAESEIQAMLAGERT